MSTQEFHPDRFTQLHNSMRDVLDDLFGRHHASIGERLDKLERIIMTGFAEVEAEVTKVKGVVVGLKNQIATLSAAGGATSAQLDQIISDTEAALAAPADVGGTTDAPPTDGATTAAKA